LTATRNGELGCPLDLLAQVAPPERYREHLDVRFDFRQEAERIASRIGVDTEAAIAEAERILAESR